MPGIPFQSKLEPFHDFIREWRVKRWSYVRIAQVLTQDHGMKVSPNAVFSFVKARTKRREVYTLPPRQEVAFAAPGQVAWKPVTEDPGQRDSDFFISANQPSNPELNKTKNEKRPYRLDF